MKKLILIVLLLTIGGTNLFAQSGIPPKRVFFEALTNASCAPCATNDPYLKNFLQTKGDSIVTVKYHANFPGFDPMYNDNPSQNLERFNAYYGMNFTPFLNVDGKVFHDVWPWNPPNLMENAFRTRINVTPQLTMSVTDERIAGDSIHTIVTIDIPSSLPAGDYKLRLFAVERVINFSNPPGSNGVSSFEYVFRKAYPNTTGTVLQQTSGNYVFDFYFLRESNWVDSNIYTIAFVQNDAASNKEVLNVAKSDDATTAIDPISTITPEKYNLYQNYPNPFNPSTNIKFDIPKTSRVKLSVFNTLGKEVAVLVNEQLVAGQYDLSWNGAGVTSGVYFYKLETSEFTEVKKMMLIK